MKLYNKIVVSRKESWVGIWTDYEWGTRNYHFSVVPIYNFVNDCLLGFNVRAAIFQLELISEIVQVKEVWDLFLGVVMWTVEMSGQTFSQL